MLKKRYDVTLGHIEWRIAGTNFGEAQTVAATRQSQELGLPFVMLASMYFPEWSHAMFSWVPVCISTIMHHAGDPCVYPAPSVRRYDSVAFGFSHEESAGGNHIKRNWVAGMRDYAYDGPVLFPLDGLTRSERAALIPKHLLDMTVSCYLGTSAEEPCGRCWKCKGESNGQPESDGTQKEEEEAQEPLQGKV